MSDNEHSLRFNEGKLRWDYVHFASLAPMVRVLEYGAIKYAPMNWQKPPNDPKQHLTSMMRHLTALLDGETNDPESGLPHIGHIMCNALFHSYHTTEKPIELTVAGSVGIGAATPIAKLCVSETPNNLFQVTDSSGNVRFSINSSGSFTNLIKDEVTKEMEDEDSVVDLVDERDRLFSENVSNGLKLGDTCWYYRFKMRNVDDKLRVCDGPHTYTSEIYEDSTIRVFKTEEDCNIALLKIEAR